MQDQPAHPAKWAVLKQKTHACGCSCAGMVACVAQSLPPLPRLPSVCEYSGNSALGGSCSAFHKL